MLHWSAAFVFLFDIDFLSLAIIKLICNISALFNNMCVLKVVLQLSLGEIYFSLSFLHHFMTCDELWKATFEVKVNSTFADIHLPTIILFYFSVFKFYRMTLPQCVNEMDLLCKLEEFILTVLSATLINQTA